MRTLLKILIVFTLAPFICCCENGTYEDFKIPYADADSLKTIPIFPVQEEDLMFYSQFAEPNNPRSLNLINPYGNMQNIHPKVLYFPQGWNGYSFWMAYTPYPYGAVEYENPCIAVSFDGINWGVPEGLSNPLAVAPDFGYNSDTHLVYNEKNNTLECWYRPYKIQESKDKVVRRISSDGNNWSEEETVLDWSDASYQMRMSQAVEIIDGRYVMLYCNGVYMVMLKSVVPAPAVEWGERVNIKPATGDLHIWHADFISNPDNEKELEIIATAFTPGNDNNSASLYYFKYDLEKGTSTTPGMIIDILPKGTGYDDKGIYRSSILKIDGCYYIYYSSIDRQNHRRMSLSYGPDIFNLKPFPLPSRQ